MTVEVNNYEEQILTIKNLLQSAITTNDQIKLTKAYELCQDLLKFKADDTRLLQMLAMIFSKTNRIQEAAATLKRLSAILEQPTSQSKCITDIGLMLNSIGKKEEAQAELEKAISLDPNNAAAYYNLGLTYAEDKDFANAINNYREAIRVNPNFAQAYNNLAQALLNDFTKAKEALFYQNKALELSPNNQSIIDNYALILLQNGEFEAAKIQFEKILKDNPQRWEDLDRLLDILFRLRELNSLLTIANNALDNQPPIDAKKRIYAYLLMVAFIQEDFASCQHLIDVSINLYKESADTKKTRWARIYNIYINALVSYRNNNQDLYIKKTDNMLHVVGESHCLSPAHLIINLNDRDYKVHPQLVTGCKIWHLISPYDNQYKAAFNVVLNKIPNNSLILICFGEIDCRIDEGIMNFYRKKPDLDISQHIEQMVLNYIEILSQYIEQKKLEIIVQGVPAPHIDFSTTIIDEKEIFLKLIKNFNFYLKQQCQSKNIRFLDVHNLTVNEEGVSNGVHHIDSHHLKPNYLLELLK